LACRYALIFLFTLATVPCEAAEDPARLAQQRIKAAFLYKFAAYVDWPAAALPEAQTPIVIGVAGADAIARELERVVAGRQVDGRALQVRQLGRAELAAECCHILFIGSDFDAVRATRLLVLAQGRPILTVTEADAEHPKGSVINFLVAEDRIRFDVSRGAAGRNGLHLRSPLLGVARQVLPP
jgi:hypothetical protein